MAARIQRRPGRSAPGASGRRGSSAAPGRRRSPRTRKWTNQSRTWARFSARRNGTPPRVSSWLSSGTRMNRTGRLSERRTVNSASACADRRPQVALGVLDEQRRPDVRGHRQRRDRVEVLRFLPRAPAELDPRPLGPRDVAGEEQQPHVDDRAARERRLEAVGLADDPVGQVAAVRAAGHPEPLGVGQPVGDRLVHAGQHVGHRPVAPVAEVGAVERLAVALGPARVRGQHRDPGAREDLPLEHRRVTVERVRAAVDLEHQRLPAAAGRVQPALDLASVALPSPVDRLDPRELLAQRDVERRQRPRRLRAARRRARLERHDLGERRRRRSGPPRRGRDPRPPPRPSRTGSGDRPSAGPARRRRGAPPATARTSRRPAP